MNRQQRRTRGKYVIQRLTQLRNSKTFTDIESLKDIPKETIELLSKGQHDNPTLQKQYNTYSRILQEIIELEYELNAMKADLLAKHQKAVPH
jgi:hypothetical protein